VLCDVVWRYSALFLVAQVSFEPALEAAYVDPEFFVLGDVLV
jgi:hypothetical protein